MAGLKPLPSPPVSATNSGFEVLSLMSLPLLACSSGTKHHHQYRATWNKKKNFLIVLFRENKFFTRKHEYYQN